MSSNFLQFNPSQINQQNDAAYTGDSTRAGGAPLDSLFGSELANKAFYQWSTFIAAFGQMMANKGFTVSDSVLATLVAQLTNVLTTADVRGGLVSLAYASALNLNATKSLGWQVTLTGNTTFTISGAQVGDELTLVLIQNYAGGHTITWPSGFEDALQPDPTPNAVSVLGFKVQADGTVWTAQPVLSSSGINSTAIGQGSPAAGTFSSLQAPTMPLGDSSTHAATTAFVLENTMPMPTNNPGPGQVTSYSGTLPSGGVWFYASRNPDDSYSLVGVAPGGTYLGPTGHDNSPYGMCWRIS